MSSNSGQKSWRIGTEIVTLLADLAESERELGARLEALRELRGLSQEQAAHEVGVTSRQWSRWVNEGTLPRARQLAAIASAFDVSLAELLDEDRQPTRLEMIERQLEAVSEKLDRLLGLADLVQANRQAIEANTAELATLKNSPPGPDGEFFSEFLAQVTSTVSRALDQRAERVGRPPSSPAADPRRSTARQRPAA